MAIPLARELTAVNAHSMAGEELKPFFLTERTTNMMREKRRTAPPILTPTHLFICNKRKRCIAKSATPEKREYTPQVKRHFLLMPAFYHRRKKLSSLLRYFKKGDAYSFAVFYLSFRPSRYAARGEISLYYNAEPPFGACAPLSPASAGKG